MLKGKALDLCTKNKVIHKIIHNLWITLDYFYHNKILSLWQFKSNNLLEIKQNLDLAVMSLNIIFYLPGLIVFLREDIERH